MALGWITVLKLVPWTDVISSAPKIAEGAKKLWKTVSKTPPEPAPQTADVPVTLSPEARAMAALESRVAAVEAATQTLHEQMLASSALLNTMAEQNTQLIQRIEIYRRRFLLLTGITALAAIAAIIALVLVLSP